MTQKRKNPLPKKPDSKKGRVEEIPETGHFDLSANDEIERLAYKIQSLKEKSERLLSGVRDVWTPLGRRAPLLRAAFNGVTLPIKYVDQMIDEMGGRDRIIIAPSLDGTLTVVTVLDFVEALAPFLDTFLPVETWQSLVHEIILWEHQSRKDRDGKPRLLRNMECKHLRKILLDPAKVREVFPNQLQRVYSERFEKVRQYYVSKGDKARSDFLPMVPAPSAPMAMGFPLPNTPYLDIIKILLQAYTDKFKIYDLRAAIVKSKCSSAITHLNSAEQFINQAMGYLDNVLNANNLTNTILDYNNNAKNLLDSANQLLLQAIADLAAAESILQEIPDDAEAQNAVAEAQAKLEQVQILFDALVQKMGQAEAHKDVLAIPIVCATIRCIEEDPCCDDDWNGVNVYITNTSNPDVSKVSGTTSGNGSVTLCGRFGNCGIAVETDGPGGWHETRYYNMGSNSQSFTIKVDLPGWE